MRTFRNSVRPGIAEHSWLESHHTGMKGRTRAGPLQKCHVWEEKAEGSPRGMEVRKRKKQEVAIKSQEPTRQHHKIQRPSPPRPPQREK
jgi:hypothetical protein